MSQRSTRVQVTGTGSFLPGDPVERSAIDDVLGPLVDAPDSVRRFMASVGKRLLDQGGVETRHFAIDPETRRLTHGVASLAEVAARRALEDAGREPNDVDLLIIGSPLYDQGTPPTSVMLQERLGIRTCVEMEIHSNCSGVGKGVQIAEDALRVGRHDCVLFVYVQLSSVLLTDGYLNQASLTREQALLRYILSDGAGALVLERADTEPAGHDLLLAHAASHGYGLPPAMTAGAGALAFPKLDLSFRDVYDRGDHHLTQDFQAIGEMACEMLLKGVRQMLEGLGLEPLAVDHYVWSIPTRRLWRQGVDLAEAALGLPEERQPFRAQHGGYCGGASILVHLDRMARAGEIQPGETVLCCSVESSKWMTGGLALRW